VNFQNAGGLYSGQVPFLLAKRVALPQKKVKVEVEAQVEH
jgi:hypothetical protein